MNQKQRGVGLIELMIAMLIGTFLLAGMLSLFTGNKRTYLYQQSQAMESESQRFASRVLTQLFHQVGHSTLSTASINGKHIVFPEELGFKPGQVMKGFDVGAVGKQVIDYRYAAGPDIITCAGAEFPEQLDTTNSPTNTVKVTQRVERLSIVGGILVCDAVDIIDGAVQSSNRIPLIGDMAVPAAQQIEVLDMDLEYGFDFKGNDDAVDRYLKANEVAAVELDSIDVDPAAASVLTTPWQRVKSINIALSIRTGGRVTDEPQTYSFSVELSNLLETAQ